MTMQPVRLRPVTSERGYLSVAAPQLYVVAVHKLSGLSFGGGIINATHDPAFWIQHVGPVLEHCRYPGPFKGGDESQSCICEAVSNSRAWRISLSR
jgi:hypothetical protein